MRVGSCGKRERRGRAGLLPRHGRVALVFAFVVVVVFVFVFVFAGKQTGRANGCAAHSTLTAAWGIGPRDGCPESYQQPAHATTTDRPARKPFALHGIVVRPSPLHRASRLMTVECRSPGPICTESAAHAGPCAAICACLTR